VDATIHLRIEFPKLDIVLCACGLVCVNLSFCAKEDTLLVFLHTDQVRWPRFISRSLVLRREHHVL